MSSHGQTSTSTMATITPKGTKLPSSSQWKPSPSGKPVVAKRPAFYGAPIVAKPPPPTPSVAPGCGFLVFSDKYDVNGQLKPSNLTAAIVPRGTKITFTGNPPKGTEIVKKKPPVEISGVTSSKEDIKPAADAKPAAETKPAAESSRVVLNQHITVNPQVDVNIQLSPQPARSEPITVARSEPVSPAITRPLASTSTSRPSAPTATPRPSVPTIDVKPGCDYEQYIAAKQPPVRNFNFDLKIGSNAASKPPPIKSGCTFCPAKA